MRSHWGFQAGSKDTRLTVRLNWKHCKPWIDLESWEIGKPALSTSTSGCVTCLSSQTMNCFKPDEILKETIWVSKIRFLFSVYFQPDGDPFFLNLSSPVLFSGIPISGSHNASSSSVMLLFFLFPLFTVGAEITHTKRIRLDHPPLIIHTFKTSFFHVKVMHTHGK